MLLLCLLGPTGESDDPGYGESEHDTGQHEEHQHQIDDGEPPVLGRGVAQQFGHRDGYASHGRYRVPQEYAEYVEEEVSQRHLGVRNQDEYFISIIIFARIL